MNEMLICQSCSMPMVLENQYGTEADGSFNKEYCVHCYQNGEFTRPNGTLEELIDAYAPQWGEWTNRPDLPIEQAKEEIRAKLSPLKRWCR